MMHTILVILAGLLLGSVFGLFGHLWGEGDAGLVTGLRIFIPVWLAVAALNLWIGVSRAGYTIAEELPILALVFAVPAGVAFVTAQVIAH